MHTHLKSTVAVAAFAAALATASQAANVTIDPGASWLSYLNVFETQSNGGDYVTGFPYAFALNTASFSGDNLTLGATQINNENDAFWWVGGVSGPGAVANKSVQASSYVETLGGGLSGTTVTFTGTILSNTLVAGYTAYAFIIDFAPDFSSNVPQIIPLSTGDFSVTLGTINDPARVVQYGFIMEGPNVWATDVASQGNIVLAPTAIPEPSSFAALAGLATLGLAAARRRRRS